MSKYISEMNVGPGAYNIHQKQFGKEAMQGKISPEHRNNPDREKMGFPGVHSYNPLPVYNSFEKSLQLEKLNTLKGKSKAGNVHSLLI